MGNIFADAYDDATREIREEEKNGKPVELESSNEAAKEAKNRLWAEIANVMRDLSDNDRFDVANGTLNVLKIIAVTSAAGLRQITDDQLDLLAHIKERAEEAMAEGDGEE